MKRRRARLLWIFAFLVLPVVLVLWQSTVQVTTPEIRKTTGLEPKPTPPQTKIDVVAPKLKPGGFAAEWLGRENRSYLWEQNGNQISIYWIEPDGSKRYVGAAVDEGNTVVFTSFYSPVYQQWGVLPSLHLKDNTLVAVADNGAEVVYFRRPPEFIAAGAITSPASLP